MKTIIIDCPECGKKIDITKEINHPVSYIFKLNTHLIKQHRSFYLPHEAIDYISQYKKEIVVND